MLLQAFLFSAMDALVKLATARHPTGQIIFFRNFFALLPLYFFVRQAGGFGVLRTQRLGQHILRSLGGIASMFCLFLAYAYMPLADAMAIATSGPIFLTALSVPLLGEQVGWRRWGAVFAGFIGILIVTRPGSGVFGVAAFLPLSGAFFYALAMVQIRKLSSSEPPARIVFYFTIAAMILGGASLPWQWVTPTPLTLVYLVAIGLVGGFAQMAIYRSRLRHRLRLRDLGPGAGSVRLAGGGRHRRQRHLHPAPRDGAPPPGGLAAPLCQGAGGKLKVRIILIQRAGWV